MGRLSAPRLIAALALLPLAASPAIANRQSDELKLRAASDLYNLDQDEAVAAYRKAVSADPEDAAAYRGLASALWLSITFARGNLTVDDYIGRVSRTTLKLPPAPPAQAADFRDAIDRALALARKHVTSKPKDADGHFQLGAALGLRATYVVTVDGSVLGAFGAAREAFAEHETVLDLDPKRADAGLVVGTYRYAVAALTLPLRWMAYLSGFGGGREKGLQLIERAAAYPGDNQTDAKLALVLLFNREGRYDPALAQLAGLREQYPRNRLLWLETGATYLRAGRAAEAERFLVRSLAKLRLTTAPACSARRHYGDTSAAQPRAALGHRADAEDDLKKAIGAEGRGWVHGRAHLELGKLLLKGSDRSAANAEFRQAITLCDNDNDVASADEARRLLER